MGNARLVALGCQRHELAAEHTRLLEHAVDECEHVGVAAEIGGQFYDAIGARRSHRLKMAAVYRDVGPAEPVDRLLRVAHRAQAAGALAREALDHVDLHLVGVLELVDHHELELVAVEGRDAGVVLDGARRHDEQVVVVEHAALAFALRIRRKRAARQLHKRFQQARRSPQPQFHDERGELG